MANTNSILLVEDSDDDAELTIRAFRQARIANPIDRAADGVEALDYLFKDQKSLPSIVLLDLKLPKVNGLEVLKEIRSHSKTKHLPVVILTSSAEDKDRLAAYSQYANSYVQKPVDYNEFVEAAKQLGLYWVLLNQPVPHI